jgi:hypothetical protein
VQSNKAMGVATRDSLTWEVGQVKQGRIKLFFFSSIVAAVSGISFHVAASYIAPAFEGRRWLVWSTVAVVFFLSLILRWRTYAATGESQIKNADGIPKQQTSGVNISSSALYGSTVAGRDIVEGNSPQHEEKTSQNG